MGSDYAHSLQAVQQDAARLAQYVLDVYNVTTYPVSLSRIVAGEHATVKGIYGPVHGTLTPTDRGYIISVSRRLHRHRRRFTIGHELGHLLLDRGRSGQWRVPIDVQQALARVPVGGPTEERFCNAFASYLLLPNPALSTFTNWRQVTFASLIHAALTLDVGLEPLIWRALEILPFNGGLLLFRVRPKPNDHADIQLRLDSGRFPKDPGMFVPRHASAPELYRAAQVSPDELLEQVKLHVGSLKGTRSLLVWRYDDQSALALDRSRASDASSNALDSWTITGTWHRVPTATGDSAAPTAAEIGRRLMAIVVPPEVNYAAERAQGFESPRLQFGPQPPDAL